MKRIVTLLIVFLLILSGCQLINKPYPDPPIINDDPDPGEDPPKKPAYTEHAGIAWQADDLVAVAFLGYADDTQFGYYTDTGEFINFVLFYPDITYVTKVYNEGDEVYMIIPRYRESEVTIQTKGDAPEQLYHEDGEGSILLKTNLSDIHASTQVTIKLDDQEFVFDPALDNAEGRLIRPNQGILDLSFYTSPDFNEFKYDIFVFKGSWKTTYHNKQGEDKSIRLIFHGLDHSSDQDQHEITYIDDQEDLVIMGSFFFIVPEDFKEPIDAQTNLLYINFHASSNELYQTFGKFAYQFLDFDTLLLKHVSYDPLAPTEEGFMYILKRN